MTGKNKLLVICGPTATGKTAFAAQLAKKFNGELVSADSRQVFKHMDIVTGKDKPEGVAVWGYDLAGPSDEFSVAHYVELAKKFIDDIHSRGKLPIIVGGTGLYIKGVIDGIATINVPPNKILRMELAKASVETLLKKLKKVDPLKLEAMNSSDKVNPRRLVRAIEVAGVDHLANFPSVYDSLFVGLMLSLEELASRINARVDARLKAGVLEEIDKILEMGVTWDAQSMSSLGYKQLRVYYDNNKSMSEAINEWKNQEIKYAKRQMTWFTRDNRINWSDVSDKSYEWKIKKLVEKWYSSK